MNINDLVNITSRAWSMEILATMHSGVPGRQAPLLSVIGANRTAFMNSLAHLIDLGLLVRNPGHGHPLRPEYKLTLQGTKVAKFASNLVSIVPDENEFAILRRIWTLPVLTVIRTPRRFTEIKSDLISVTDRALSKSLDQLLELQWLQRDVDIDVRPPIPRYHAINTGFKICQAVNEGF